MPYREKIAWLSLAALAVAFIPYFAIVAAVPFRDQAMPNLHMLALYAAAAAVRVLILGAGHLYLRRGSPEDARTPPDERDLAIKHRSLSAAYYVLVAGMILVGVVMPFSTGGWAIVNTAI